MITEAQVEAYRRDGFIVVENLMTSADASAMRQVIAEFVAGAAAVETHTAVYDLEPGHTRSPGALRTRSSNALCTSCGVLMRRTLGAVLQRLIGRDLRLHGSKLNMKAACYGSPVEWHQDWAFYPHTNDDLLAIGVMLDDMDLENGPLMVTPGSHKGRLFYSGFAFARELGSIVSGGPAPFVASALVAWARGAWWPVALYIPLLSGITAFAVWCGPETYHNDISADADEKVPAMTPGPAPA